MKLCKLGQVLVSLPDRHRLALQTALDTPHKVYGLSDAKLSYEITQAGFEISYNMVNLHRRKVCRCE